MWADPPRGSNNFINTIENKHYTMLKHAKLKHKGFNMQVLTQLGYN